MYDALWYKYCWYIEKKKKSKQAVWLKHWLDKELAESSVVEVMRGQFM